MKGIPRTAALALLALLGAAAPRCLAADHPPPDQVIGATGIGSGLFVQVGCADGALVQGMAARGGWLAHGLDASPAQIERGRRRIQEAGLAGTASLEYWSYDYLPYATNLVSVLVAEDLGRIGRDEVMRVLTPGGAAYLKTGGQWTAVKKPRPPEMGEWNSSRCNASGNPVAADTAIEAPRRVRWLSPGIGGNALSADGRVYHGGLAAVDAYNGLPLWSAKLNLMAAGGGRVYGLSGNGLVALDAVSGQPIGAYPGADKPGVVLYLPSGVGEKPTLLTADGASVRALDAMAGTLHWNRPAEGVKSLVAGDGKVFFLTGKGKPGTAVCLNLANGQEVWRVSHEWLPATNGCSYRYGVLAYEISSGGDDGKGCALRAISAADGADLWNYPYDPGMVHGKTARAIFARDLLWAAGRSAVGLDPQTGKPKKTVQAGWGHCWVPMATERFLIAGEMDFTDFETGRHVGNRISKASCGRGFLPANGLLYTFGSGCVCYPMLKGSLALAGDDPPRAGAAPAPAPVPAVPGPRPGVRPGTAQPFGRLPGLGGAAESVPPVIPPYAAQRLEKGPAFGAAAPRAGAGAQDEWGCYRGDAWRSGCPGGAAPGSLAPAWEKPVAETPRIGPLEFWKRNSLGAEPLTAPTVAQGLVFVADRETHRLLALDARSGAGRWTFIANGRIDTPPTIHEGFCLFGTRSGYAYCLVAATGEMVWRLRLGPEDRRIVAYGQLESAWPAPGTALVTDGLAFFGAGRHPLADGGLSVCGVEPATGRIAVDTVVPSLPMPRWYGRLGNDHDTFDLLVRDGGAVALGRWRFDLATRKGAWDRPSGSYTARATGVLVLRGLWSYAADAPNNRGRSRRPLMVFDDETLYVSAGELYAAKLDTAAALKEKDSKYREPAASPGDYRIEWSPYSVLKTMTRKWAAKEGSGARGLARAGDLLIAAGGDGSVRTISVTDGKVIARGTVGAAPVWDGLAVAYGRVYVSTSKGTVVCLGDGAVPEPPPATQVARGGPPPDPARPAAREPAQPASPPAGPAAGPPPAPSEWETRLLARMGREAAAGRPGRVSLAALGQTFRVTAVDARNNLSLAGSAMSLTYAWDKLTPVERANLAASLARDDDADSCCLAAYFLIKAGRADRADELLLKVKDVEKVREARAAAQ